MDIFGNEDISTDYEKNINTDLSKLLKEYEEKFDEELNTENLQMSPEQIIQNLKHCLKEGITLDVIFPGINDEDF